MHAFHAHLAKVFVAGASFTDVSIHHIHTLLMLLVTPIKDFLTVDWSVVRSPSFDVFSKLLVNAGVLISLLTIAAEASMCMRRQTLHLLTGLVVSPARPRRETNASSTLSSTGRRLLLLF